jgi:hypothetical protein
MALENAAVLLDFPTGLPFNFRRNIEAGAAGC